MRCSALPALAAGLLLLAARPAPAVSPVPVVIGPSRDGAPHELQHKVNTLLGAGRLDVRTDFVGARAGDPDPWSWANTGEPLTLHLVDRKSSSFVVGWYSEDAARRDDDDDDDEDDVEDLLGGVILDSGRKRGAIVTFRVPATVLRFGLFVADTGCDDDRAWIRHRTNRTLNSPGPRGRGAAHEPYDGDVQLLVYDVARWLGPRTWLVAGETGDSGRRVGHDDDETDNDYSDVLFTISGAATTPTVATTFGRVKSLFR